MVWAACLTCRKNTMTITSEQVAQSLVDIVTTNDTDTYLLDTNAIGISFFTNDEFSIHDLMAFNGQNYLLTEQLQEWNKNATTYLKMISSYEMLGTTQKVVKETEKKLQLLKDLRGGLGGRGKHTAHGYRKPVAMQREKKVLEEIIEKEKETLEIMKKRIYVASPSSISPFEKLAVYAYNDYGGARFVDAWYHKKKKNYNDEMIVATAMHLATACKKSVIIITNDRGLLTTARTVTEYVYADECQAPLFKKIVRDGKINVMNRLNREGRYTIAFSSVDYSKRKITNATQDVKEIVEQCEAVIRQARTSSVAEPQRPAQSLYSSTA